MATKELTVFDFQDNKLRVIEHNGEPWFVANEVCKALVLTNTSKSLERVSDHQKSGVTISDPHGRMQKTSKVACTPRRGCDKIEV